MASQFLSPTKENAVLAWRDRLQPTTHVNDDSDVEFTTPTPPVTPPTKSSSAAQSVGRVSRSSSTKSINSDLSENHFASLAQDRRRDDGELLTELRKLRHHVNLMAAAVAKKAVQLDAINSHCALARREALDLRIQLSNNGKKARASTKPMSRFITHADQRCFQQEGGGQ